MILVTQVKRMATGGILKNMAIRIISSDLGTNGRPLTMCSRLRRWQEIMKSKTLSRLLLWSVVCFVLTIIIALALNWYVYYLSNIRPPFVDRSKVSNPLSAFEGRLRVGVGGPGACFFQNCQPSADDLKKMSKLDCQRGAFLTEIALEQTNGSELNANEMEATDSAILLTTVRNFTAVPCTVIFHVGSMDFDFFPANDQNRAGVPDQISAELKPGETQTLRKRQVAPKNQKVGTFHILAGNLHYHNIGQESLILTVRSLYRGRTKQQSDARIEIWSGLATLFTSILVPLSVSAIGTFGATLFLKRPRRKKSGK